MPKRKPWYETLFERDYYDYFLTGGPISREEWDRMSGEQVEFVLHALELPERARVLDLCCGWGRHSVRLAQRGYRVTGLDLSRYHLQLAKAAARQADVQVEWLHGDMRQIPGRGGRFAAVINCFTSFGYFDDEEENQRVLDSVARALRPGGRLFIDVMNHDRLMRVFREHEWGKRADGSLNLEERHYDIHKGRVDVTWTFVEPSGKRHQQFHSVRLYTFPELAGMLDQAGLTVRQTWGGFDGSEFGMRSPRMIVLAEKA